MVVSAGLAAAVTRQALSAVRTKLLSSASVWRLPSVEKSEEGRPAVVKALLPSHSVCTSGVEAKKSPGSAVNRVGPPIWKVRSDGQCASRSAERAVRALFDRVRV